nr:unnamed protein product [Callosobruchus chinensis]
MKPYSNTTEMEAASSPLKKQSLSSCLPWVLWLQLYLLCTFMVLTEEKR